MATYTLIGERGKSVYEDRPKIKISEAGALIIWAAYVKLYGNCQTMQRREERGGIAYLSELDHFKKQGALDKDFDYTKYLVA